MFNFWLYIVMFLKSWHAHTTNIQANKFISILLIYFIFNADQMNRLHIILFNWHWSRCQDAAACYNVIFVHEHALQAHETLGRYNVSTYIFPYPNYKLWKCKFTTFSEWPNDTTTIFPGRFCGVDLEYVDSFSYFCIANMTEPKFTSTQ